MPEKVQHKDFDVEDVLSQLKIEEKIGLLSGTDFWHTLAIPRLGVPAIRVSDGPNGVRGTRFFNGVPAACFPCGTSIAATWDVDLIRQAGQLQAEEAIEKGASIILGPTVNMQRSPLGGRGFESYSEDPCLAGLIAAATVAGMQSKGVGATMKHFVANDQEHQRQSGNSIVSERALREIYLMPFQLTERDAKPYCYMTCYNKVNGIHGSEDPKLLQKLLRDEWGFDGLIVSDWFGVYSTAEAIKAGLDLEMPGPSYTRGPLLSAALNSGKLTQYHVDQRVREVLKLVKKVLPLGIPENAPENMRDTPETAALLRKISSNGIVLMKNNNNILPFGKDKNTAVIGPNGNFATFCGGGSASLVPYYARSPLEGVRAKVPDAKYLLGVPSWKQLPYLTYLTKTEDGKDGLDMYVYLDPPSKKDREAIDKILVTKSEIMVVDYKHPKLTSDLYYVTVKGKFTPEETADYEFGLSVAGIGKLYIDGECLVDNETKQTLGTSFFGSGTIEEIGVKHCEAGKTYDIYVEFGTFPLATYESPGATPMGAGGLRIGCAAKTDTETEIRKAVQLAKEVDQVVLCVGLNGEWEAEGYDRPNMDLPPGSDDLIQAVLEANPNTAVIMQSGTPVTMPWLSQADCLVQAWYGGNETGNAIADVVFGDVNPSGKTSLSFPHRNEDNPAFLNYRTEKGRVLYGEDVYVGYRFYERTKKDVAFPFGHGLSYTEFTMSDLKVSEVGDDIKVSVKTSNTGKVAGAEVVQAYVSQAAPSIGRPVKELKGFSKIYLEPGADSTVEISIPKKYAASFYDEERDAWTMEKDDFTVHVGNSSANTPLKGGFKVEKTTWWKGL